MSVCGCMALDGLTHSFAYLLSECTLFVSWLNHRHLRPIGGVVGRSPFLPHLPTAVGALCGHLHRATTKAFVEGVQGLHECALRGQRLFEQVTLVVRDWADFAQHDAGFFVLVLGLVHALAQRVDPPENDQAVVGGVGQWHRQAGAVLRQVFSKPVGVQEHLNDGGLAILCAQFGAGIGHKCRQGVF